MSSSSEEVFRRTLISSARSAESVLDLGGFTSPSSWTRLWPLFCVQDSSCYCVVPAGADDSVPLLAPLRVAPLRLAVHRHVSGTLPEAWLLC